MESDLEHLAEGEKLRLGQAGALVPRTEQDHISSDAGAPSPVCHKMQGHPSQCRSPTQMARSLHQVTDSRHLSCGGKGLVHHMMERQQQYAKIISPRDGKARFYCRL